MKKVRIFAAILLTAMLLLCLCGCVRYEAPNGNVYVNNAPGERIAIRWIPGIRYWNMTA